MPLFLAFLLVPIIEIALFIQVGGLIGLWPTLGIVILTAVLGTWLVRTQGQLALGQLRGSFERLSDPTEPLAHGAMILLAGALLLTPGFFTDAFGFLLLVPGFRTRAFAYLRSKVTVASFQMGSDPRHSARPRPADSRGDVIDGDYKEVTPRPRRDDPSGWVEGPK
ncbi:FxsA family protein [Tritonibacter scottomollicae]|uniref:FxsA family protein n=1 Tax=Tritonibacter scottomollicae TaxID=483013 RepID=A0ABZ0HER9_TRISK|nr:FxsA family protein [Tritonibacter scottomollicae]WOI32476.1 FxsA family protein [Tritonibacter scottomollicae]